MYLTICVELAAGHFDLGLVQMDTFEFDEDMNRKRFSHFRFR